MPEAASSVRQRSAAKAMSKEDRVKEVGSQAEEQYDAKAKLSSKVPSTRHSCAIMQPAECYRLRLDADGLQAVHGHLRDYHPDPAL